MMVTVLLLLKLALTILIAEDTCEGEYLNGARHGHWKCYYEDGALREEGTYEQDQKNGYWKLYHATGKLALEGSYQKGEETGIWKVYDEGGQQIDTIDYGS